MVTEAEILKQLERVIDPEIGIDIVNLGLIYNVEILEDTQSVVIEMTLTSAGCPLANSIREAVESVLRGLEGVRRVQCNLVWSPAWNPNLITAEGRARLGWR